MLLARRHVNVHMSALKAQNPLYQRDAPRTIMKLEPYLRRTSAGSKTCRPPREENAKTYLQLQCTEPTHTHTHTLFATACLYGKSYLKGGHRLKTPADRLEARTDVCTWPFVDVPGVMLGSPACRRMHHEDACCGDTELNVPASYRATCRKLGRRTPARLDRTTAWHVLVFRL